MTDFPCSCGMYAERRRFQLLQAAAVLFSASFVGICSLGAEAVAHMESDKAHASAVNDAETLLAEIERRERVAAPVAASKETA